MSNISKRIRKYVKCPQFDGGTEYGEWGALRIDQRRLIRELCEHCEMQEEFADTFFKETQALKHQLAEKDQEIEELKEMCDFLKENKICTVNFNDRTETYLFPKNAENIIRHQVCEEIRKKLKKCITPACGTYIVYYEAKNVEDTLDQIEGESKC